MKDIQWTISPPMFRVNNQINDTFMVDDKSIARWIRHMPIVRVSPSFRKESLESGDNEVRFGYAVPLELSSRLGLSDTPRAEVKPAIRCLKAIVYSEDENFLNAGMLKNILKHCTEHGLEVSGDLWGVAINAHRENGATRRFYRLYIPAIGKTKS